MARGLAIRLVRLAIVLAIVLGCRPPNVGAAVLVAIGGASWVTGELGDYVSGDGRFFGAILCLGFGEQTFATLGVRSGTLSSDSDDWRDPQYLTVDGGVSYYLVERPTHRLRPFLAGQVGTGRTRWGYSPTAQATTGVTDDAIVFFYIAPEIGLEVKVTDRFDVRGGARYMFSLYDSRTRENIDWTINGGNMAQVYAGIGFTF